LGRYATKRSWVIPTPIAAAFGDTFYDDPVLGVWKMLSIGAVLSSPVIERDVIYFGSTDGNVYAIS
jgi:outer membrane protein assembly factor BamB